MSTFTTYYRHAAGVSGRDRIEVVAYAAENRDKSRWGYLAVTRGGNRVAELRTADATAVSLITQVNVGAGDARAARTTQNECPRSVLADWMENHAELFTRGPYHDVLAGAAAVAVVAGALRAADNL